MLNMYSAEWLGLEADVVSYEDLIDDHHQALLGEWLAIVDPLPTYAEARVRRTKSSREGSKAGRTPADSHHVHI